MHIEGRAVRNHSALALSVAAGFSVGLAGSLMAQIPDFTPATPLVSALMSNDTAEAKRLLAQGANPDEARFLSFPAVFLPVIYQNRDLLRLMVEKGADVTARDASGSTGLMWAASNENGDPALVEDLLKLSFALPPVKEEPQLFGDTFTERVQIEKGQVH